jgi:DNA-binding GntR family transcriptional regulator
MSRTPVRDALRRLAGEGVVELSRNRGAQVASFTPGELASLYNVRSQIEPMAAALAVHGFTEDDLSRMEDLCEQMEAIVASGEDPARITPLNNAFHDMFIDGCGNRHLSAAVHSVVRPAVVTHTFRHYDERQMRRSMQHHWELLDAARARDGEWAEAVTRVHILASRHATASRD